MKGNLEQDPRADAWEPLFVESGHTISSTMLFTIKHSRSQGFLEFHEVGMIDRRGPED